MPWWKSKTANCIVVAMGAVRLATGDPLEVRLLRIFQELSELIGAHHPEVVAIEDVFHAANAKSALRLGHVRGVAMLAAAAAGLPVVAYAPLSVKSAVVGYGRAEKSQVQMMVTRLLKLDAVPEPADVADALGNRHLPSAYGGHSGAPCCASLVAPGYFSSSMISSSAARGGRTRSVGRVASASEVKFSRSIKLG